MLLLDLEVLGVKLGVRKVTMFLQLCPSITTGLAVNGTLCCPGFPLTTAILNMRWSEEVVEDVSGIWEKEIL